MYGSILSAFGGVVGSTIADSLTQTASTNSIQQRSLAGENVTADVVGAAISRAFLLLKVYFFGRE